MFMVFDDLMKKIKDTGKNYDIELIKKAYNMAEQAHRGQVRSSGEDYVTHPITVAGILVDMVMDSESIIASILHDVVEDTDVTVNDIEREFSPSIAQLVDGVTKLGQIQSYTKEERQAENVKKMLLAMTKDVRVVIIKLCDRLHNMRTLDARPPEKQIAKSKETMEVYAPIAHRLGMTSMKEELEDISIKYLDPFGYNAINEFLESHKIDREGIVNQIVENLKDTMHNYNKDVTIYGRVKSIYGIYRKSYLQGKRFEDIYDIYAVRIIVNSIIECYNALGVIHDVFMPIPHKFKDYISIPKQNGYKSLHTTVLSKEGIPFEIQIRTYEMQQNAEYGVAAHWKYKEGISKKDKLEEKIAWVRRLLEEQSECNDCTDILTSIKLDIAPEDIFVFTPNGDIKSLPVGATVIDFAYAIHSEVGNSMVGSKVNGTIVPIDYKVATGDIVEIITTKSANHGPSRDWLSIVKTSEARNKIRSWYKKEKREENILMGKTELDKEFKRNFIHLTGDSKAAFIEGLAKRQRFDNVDDFYASIGYGGVVLFKIMPRIKDDYTKLVKGKNEDEKQEPIIKTFAPKNSNGICIEGIDNCLIKFSKCCTPLPGDDIIGFITRGYGVSIHKRNCVNVKNNKEKDRWINVSWSDNVDKVYKATISICAINSETLILDTSTLFSNMRIPIYELNTKSSKNGYNEIIVTIGIQNVEHLDFILNKIGKIKNISTVKRIGI